MTDILTKTIQVTVQQVPLSKKFHTQSYSLYRYAQQTDDSRGLIARTLNYPEYLLFAIQSITPMTSNTQITQYTKKHKNKLDKLLQTIPMFSPSMIEPLFIPLGTYKKMYEYSMDTSLCFEDIILFSVFELVRVKNPRSMYNPSTMSFHQCCWINAEKSFVSFSPAEKELARINRLVNNIRLSVENLNERWESLGYPDFERAKRLCHDLQELEKQQKVILRMVKEYREIEGGTT